MNIEIDTEKLNAQSERLEKAKNRLESDFQQINSETENMKPDSESKASEVVYNEFERFKLAAADYIEDMDAYINYLKTAVNQSYIDYEDKENKLIDENIATN